MKLSNLTLVLLSIAGLQCSADETSKPVFALGEPVYLGTGCPEGTVAIVTSSDGQTVSVLLSAYVASTNGSQLLDRKSCNLAVPVSVQPGFSVGIEQVDYRGFAYVPNQTGSKADFNVQYFFAGGVGPTVKKTYGKNFNDDILITNKVQLIAWSPCGASTNFRINTNIDAIKSQASHQDVQIGLDSVDLTTSDTAYFKYTFHSKACDGKQRHLRVEEEAM